MLTYSMTFDVYIMHNGQLIKLNQPCETGQDPNGYTMESFKCNAPEPLRPWAARFTVHPSFNDMYPPLGPSQGGTELQVAGANMPMWPLDEPLVLVICDDQEQHVPLQSLT